MIVCLCGVGKWELRSTVEIYDMFTGSKGAPLTFGFSKTQRFLSQILRYLHISNLLNHSLDELSTEWDKRRNPRLKHSAS